MGELPCLFFPKRAFMRESLHCSEIASVGVPEAGHAPVSELRCVQMVR